MQAEFSQNTGRLFPDSETCASADGTTLNPSMLSAAAFRAKTLALRDSAQALKASGLGSGVRCSASFASYDPDSSSWRTSQHCLIEGLDEFSQTLPASGSMRNGKLYEHPVLGHLTEGSASLLLPTPTRSMGKRGWGLSRTGRARYSRQVIKDAFRFGYKPPIGLLEWMMGLPQDFTSVESAALETP